MAFFAPFPGEQHPWRIVCQEICEDVISTVEICRQWLSSFANGFSRDRCIVYARSR